ncbi:MAG: hypothetical protein ACPGVD_04885 [Flavobacteriales bacterium]
MKSTVDKLKQQSVKRILLVTLFFMGFGTGLELYLLDHYEGIWQLIPIFCILLCLLFLILLMINQSKKLMFTFQFILGINFLSGLLGIFLHLKTNFEFEQEMTPTLGNWKLFLESLSGALPSLAPASLIVLSLTGYSYIKLIKQKNHEL